MHTQAAFLTANWNRSQRIRQFANVSSISILHEPYAHERMRTASETGVAPAIHRHPIACRGPRVDRTWLGTDRGGRSASPGADAVRVRPICGCPNPQLAGAGECGETVAGLWLPDPASLPHAVHTESPDRVVVSTIFVFRNSVDK